MSDLYKSQRHWLEVSVKLMPHFKGELPRYETLGASGLDVRAQLEANVELGPLKRALVPTGLQISVPPGFELQVRPRSGLALKQGLTLLNTPGTIDADYRGEIKILLINLSESVVLIQDQDRIAQLVFAPVTKIAWRKVEELMPTERGVGGFGSTGVGVHYERPSGEVLT